jgi:peptidoglycan/xylan/chitin deacetylase (PgdA/CDA1 family)
MGLRNTNVESMYDYGARAGFWRVLRLFDQRGIRLTCYAVARALELNPDAGRALAEGGHEVASHGYRWIDYQHVGEEVERQHIRRAIAITEQVTGRRPVGWYTGRVSPNTRRLVVEEGGFLYDSDAYDDDLPHWVEVGGRPHLVIPYTLDNNDMKFAVAPGFTSGEDFFQHLKDGFDMLRAEGGRMMNVGLHARLAGRPGRAMALARFLDHVRSFDDVWIARREEIARHWHAHHPFSA